MNFISIEFLIFFPLVLLLFQKLPDKARLFFLLAASYLFYMNGISWIGLLLFFSTVITWLAARQIERTAEEKIKKFWLAVVLLYCLGCLVFFKQEKFLVPGISFYLFQALSYVLDVYRKKMKSERCLSCYALYVSFFPQLVAGPIERAKDLLPQLKKVVAIKMHNLSDGFWLLLRGFFKKLAVADYLAGFVEIVYEDPDKASGFAVVIATFFFAIQIYCDFSGYTDIARGAARMLGIELMDNFDHPYKAGNMQQFWRRWHISLTKWLTDYLYIPLGGSKKGGLCTFRNRMAVFAVSGLWHGLSWHYVVWGLLHGMFLTVGQMLSYLSDSLIQQSRIKDNRIFKQLYCHLARATTFVAVCFAWIFFRSDSLFDAGTLIRQIFFHFMDVRPSYLLHFFHIQAPGLFRLFLVLFCLFLLEKMPNAPHRIKTSEQAAVAAFFGFCIVTVCVLSWLVLLAENGGNTFIYFSF